MHQTTVRFGPDLWSALEDESARLGVSIAHYVRDAALARLSYTEGFELGAGRNDGAPDARSALRARVSSEVSSAVAVGAQGQLARERAQRTREEAVRIRQRLQGSNS
jgi:hypothetical protein